jgi:uncharacterized DUF497 family protein
LPSRRCENDLGSEQGPANFRKHGVRFSDAEAVLLDPQAVTRDDPIADDERRFVSVGLDVVGRIVVVVSTYRGDDVRLISARFATRTRDDNMKKEYDFSKGKRGPVIRQRGKTRITIHIDNDVLEAFRERADAAGRGYQTMINEALREHLGRAGDRVDADTIRRIVREELRKTG